MLKIKISGCLVMLLFVYSCNLEDPNSLEPEKVFIKYYGGSGVDVAGDFLVNVEADQSLGYVIFGASSSAELIGETRAGANSDFVLVFADNEGNRSDSVKSFYPRDVTGNVTCTPKRLRKTSDGGYVLVGTASYDGRTDMFVVKTDQNGNRQWDWNNNTAAVEVANDVVEVVSVGDEDIAGFIVVGSVGSGNLKQLFAVKLQSGSGLLQWTKEDGYDNAADEIVSIEATQSGTRAIAISNTTNPLAGDGGTPNGNIQVVDFAINTVDAPNFNAPGRLGTDAFDEVVVRMRKIQDNDIYLIGNSTPVGSNVSSPFFMRVSGNVAVANNTFAGLQQTIVTDINRTADGGYLVLGTRSFSADGPQIVLSRLNAFGELEGDFGGDEPFIQFGSLGDEKSAVVSYLPDGGIGFLGTIGFDNNANTLIGLIKTNRNGVLGK